MNIDTDVKDNDDEKEQNINYDNYKFIGKECVIPGKASTVFNEETLNNALNSCLSIACDDITSAWKLKQNYGKKIPELAWDKDFHGSKIEFVSDYRVKCGGDGTGNIAVSTFTIDSDSGNTFCWEITCHAISNNSWVGFVTAPARSSVTNCNTWLGSLKNGYAIGIGRNAPSVSSYSPSHKQSNGKSMELQDRTKIGDVIKFKVDWDKNCVDVYYNGKLLQSDGKSVFENVNFTAIVPAVSNNGLLGEYSIQFIDS